MWLWKIPLNWGERDQQREFEKTCFEVSVGGWSAQRGENTCFLIACFGFLEPELSAHNPEGNEATAAGGGVKGAE